jgi:predicted HTH domain antitoxin
MSITLTVSDSVARSLRLPEGEVEERLRCELALSLYAQGILSFGKATEL